jgi:hypothetical protein
MTSDSSFHVIQSHRIVTWFQRFSGDCFTFRWKWSNNQLLSCTWIIRGIYTYILVYIYVCVCMYVYIYIGIYGTWYNFFCVLGCSSWCLLRSSSVLLQRTAIQESPLTTPLLVPSGNPCFETKKNCPVCYWSKRVIWINYGRRAFCQK